MNGVTVRLQDAMDARALIERAGLNVIFSKSFDDKLLFAFRCSDRRLNRLILTFKANGITPIVDPPYTNKTFKPKLVSITTAKVKGG